MRIVFAGTPEFAAKHLYALIFEDSTHEVVAVYTQPDRPSGRGKKMTSSPVKILAEKANLPLYQPENFKSDEDRVILSNHRPDLMIVVAYGLLLPIEILNIPRYGCINVHASLLPRWRGAAPIQRAIEAGDDVTGVTMMQMDVGLDTGDILSIIKCNIEANETGGSLEAKLSKIGPAKLIHTLEKVEQRTLTQTKQNHDQCTYAKKINKEEMLIDWLRPADLLFKKILAFNPYQVTYTYLNGIRIKIWNAKLSSDQKKFTPGTIIDARNEGILVSTGMGSILLTELQLPGKNRLKVSELLRSKSRLFAPGNIFRDIG